MPPNRSFLATEYDRSFARSPPWRIGAQQPSGGIIVRLLNLFSEADGSLNARWKSASVWTVISFGAVNVLRLISNLILTRLLAPEVFGLMALAQVFLTGLQQLSDTGIGPSIIRSTRGEDTAFLQTAWTIKILRAFLVAAVACAIAWPVSRIYDEPLLFPVLCALSVSVVIHGFFAISGMTLSRNLKLRRQTVLAVTSRLLSTVFTVLAAYLLQSVWALVIGTILGALIHVYLSFVMLPPFAHRLRFERAAVKELFVFGRWILVGTALTYFGGQGLVALQGALVPIEVVGIIAIALLIGNAPRQLITLLLARVVFPAFSTVHRERPEDLPRALWKVRLVVALGAIPLLCLISLIGQPIIDLLYDDRYAAAGAILSLVALNGALSLLGAPHVQLLLTLGRSDLHATLMLSSAALNIAGLLVGFWMDGVLGMFAGVGMGTALQFGIVAVVMRRLGYSDLRLDAVSLIGLAAIYAGIYASIPTPEMFLTL
jgi:O-antigen/teichoic acid export membrane protein